MNTDVAHTVLSSVPVYCAVKRWADQRDLSMPLQRHLVDLRDDEAANFLAAPD